MSKSISVSAVEHTRECGGCVQELLPREDNDVKVEEVVSSGLCENKHLLHDANNLGRIVENCYTVNHVKCEVTPIIRFLPQDSGAEYVMHVHVDGKEVFPDKEKTDVQGEAIRMTFALPPEIWRLSDFRVDVEFRHGSNSNSDLADSFISFLLPAPAKILRSVLYLAGFGFSPLFRKIGICDDREECTLGLVITPKVNDANRLELHGVADCSCVESHSRQVSFMLTI